jgi:hypothetical protein
MASRRGADKTTAGGEACLIIHGRHNLFGMLLKKDKPAEYPIIPLQLNTILRALMNQRQ